MHLARDGPAPAPPRALERALERAGRVPRRPHDDVGGADRMVVGRGQGGVIEPLERLAERDEHLEALAQAPEQAQGDVQRDGGLEPRAVAGRPRQALGVRHGLPERPDGVGMRGAVDGSVSQADEELDDLGPVLRLAVMVDERRAVGLQVARVLRLHGLRGSPVQEQARGLEQAPVRHLADPIVGERRISRRWVDSW